MIRRAVERASAGAGRRRRDAAWTPGSGVAPLPRGRSSATRTPVRAGGGRSRHTARPGVFIQSERSRRRDWLAIVDAFRTDVLLEGPPMGVSVIGSFRSRFARL